VLEARCRLPLSGQDVYLNIAGGLRIMEPAADLAVAVALVSALSGEPVSGDTVVFGEIGLAGEIRAVPQPETRLKEAAKLGFSSAIMPERRGGAAEPEDFGLKLSAFGHLSDLIPMLRAPVRA
jgi:DNA repair protein RadA/Sms